MITHQRLLDSLPIIIERQLASDDAIYDFLSSIMVKLGAIEDIHMRSRLVTINSGAESYLQFVFEYCDHSARVFTISVQDTITFEFMTAEDYKRFGAQSGISNALKNPVRYNYVITAPVKDFNVEAASGALRTIIMTSKIRRLIPLEKDTQILSLCRGLNAAQDAYHIGEHVSAIAENMTPETVLALLDTLALTDPWAEEDYENCMNNAHLILDALVTNERRCFASAETVLIQLRDSFSERGGAYIEDVQDINALLGFITQKNIKKLS